MHAAERLPDRTTDAMQSRLGSLKRATARRAKLESLFADPLFLDKTLTDGRYLRLCAAIAWASALEEHARIAVETDVQVSLLREARAGRAAGQISECRQFIGGNRQIDDRR